VHGHVLPQHLIDEYKECQSNCAYCDIAYQQGINWPIQDIQTCSPNLCVSDSGSIAPPSPTPAPTTSGGQSIWECAWDWATSWFDDDGGRRRLIAQDDDVCPCGWYQTGTNPLQCAEHTPLRAREVGVHGCHTPG